MAVNTRYTIHVAEFIDNHLDHYSSFASTTARHLWQQTMSRHAIEFLYREDVHKPVQICNAACVSERNWNCLDWLVGVDLGDRHAWESEDTSDGNRTNPGEPHLFFSYSDGSIGSATTSETDSTTNCDNAAPR